MKEKIGKSEEENFVGIDSNLSMDEKDKILHNFVVSANAYLIIYAQTKIVYKVLSAAILLLIIMGFWNTNIILCLVIITATILTLLMSRDLFVNLMFNQIYKITDYKENILLLKRMMSGVNENNTYQAISFNTKTQLVLKPIEPRYWRDLKKSSFGSENYQITLDNILENIENNIDVNDMISHKKSLEFKTTIVNEKQVDNLSK